VSSARLVPRRWRIDGSVTSRNRLRPPSIVRLTQGGLLMGKSFPEEDWKIFSASIWAVRESSEK
jgi:hypothetical protein